MPIPVNIDADHAVVITTLPYNVTQDVFNAGTTYDVWYRYDAISGDNVLGVLGFGDLAVYRPTVSIYVNDPLGSAFNTYQNRPVYFPVTVGDVIYFKFAANGGNPNPAMLEVTLERHADVTAPQGSLAVCDTGISYPLAIVSPDADNTVLQYVQDVTNSEYGACILPDGTLLLGRGTDSVLYDSSYNELAFPTPSGGSKCRWISSNNVDRFYVASGWPFDVGNSVVVTFDAAGVQGPTTWTLDEVDVRGVAPSPNESILYYIAQFDVDTNLPVRRWDLVNDVVLSDLAAGIDTDTYMTSNLLCLSDGTVLVGYRNDVAMTQFVRRYNAGGTVINTYALTYDADTGDQDLLGRDVTDASFWYLQHGDTALDVIPKFTQFRVSDGTVLKTSEQTQFNRGRYAYDETATPRSLFGMPYSCPFWVTRTGITPTPPAPPDSDLNGPAGLDILRARGTLRAMKVRRLRRAPHLSDEQQRIFHKKFQLDIEAGVGLPSGQGVNPELLLRWSNDGGFTWSGYVNLGVGPQGQYRFRCIHYQLGQARDRVYEVTQQDPVKTVWLAAYLDVEEGLS